MYRGLNAINIDIKGRMVIPARYRERLQLEGHTTSMVLTIDTDDRCLLLYPLAEWDVLEQKLANLPSFNPAARRIQRLIIGHAMDVEIDTQYRILLPPLLREYAGIEKTAMLVGQGKKFELWDETYWNECRLRWLEEEANVDESLLPNEVKSISL